MTGHLAHSYVIKKYTIISFYHLFVSKILTFRVSLGHCPILFGLRLNKIFSSITLEW